MSADVIQFPIGRPITRSKTRKEVTAWVPAYAHKFVEGVGIPYWTGKEILCRLIRNSAYTGDPKSYPYENPYNYETIGKPWDPVQRDAPPPDCPVTEFDWDDFEQKAVWS